MIKYFLMHKNDACGSILFDEKTGRIVSCHEPRTTTSGRGLSEANASR